jgi:hypothetical protein
VRSTIPRSCKWVYNIEPIFRSYSLAFGIRCSRPISSSQHPPTPQRPLEQTFDTLRAALGRRSQRSHRRSTIRSQMLLRRVRSQMLLYPVQSQSLQRLRTFAFTAHTRWPVLWLIESGRERSQKRIRSHFGIFLRELVVRAGRVCRVWRRRELFRFFCWLLGNRKVLHAFGETSGETRTVRDISCMLMLKLMKYFTYLLMEPPISIEGRSTDGRS